MELLPAIALAFVLGAVVSSFLNVLADRMPRGQSIVRPPSHCPHCGHQLTPMELIPIVSYLVQRRRCRSCGGRIPVRVLVVEISGGVLAAFAIWWYGPTPAGMAAAVFFGFLLVVTVIDLEHRLVLDKVLAVALPLAVLSAVAWSPDVRVPVFFVDGGRLSLLLDAAIAGAAGFVVFLGLQVLSNGGMGMGDVKLAGVLGVWLGLRVLPVALMLAVVLGGIVAALLLASRSFGRKDAIPFAPFLCVGGGVGLVWGDVIGDWYLGLFNLNG